MGIFNPCFIELCFPNFIQAMVHRASKQKHYSHEVRMQIEQAGFVEARVFAEWWLQQDRSSGHLEMAAAEIPSGFRT